MQDLHDVQHIEATSYSFAAIRSDTGTRITKAEVEGIWRAMIEMFVLCVTLIQQSKSLKVKERSRKVAGKVRFPDTFKAERTRSLTPTCSCTMTHLGPACDYVG